MSQVNSCFQYAKAPSWSCSASPHALKVKTRLCLSGGIAGETEEHGLGRLGSLSKPRPFAANHSNGLGDCLCRKCALQQHALAVEELEHTPI